MVAVSADASGERNPVVSLITAKATVIMPAVLLLLGFITSSRAETITVASFPIPLMVESAEQGVFVELLQEIDRRIPPVVELRVYPARRALDMFRRGQVDGLVPALDVSLPLVVARSSPIYFKEDYAFVRNGGEVPTSLTQLSGKTLGLTAGYPYVAAVTTLDNIQYAASDEANMKKLATGRIDVFVVEKRSGLHALSSSQVANVTYDPAAPLSRQAVYFAFQDDTRGRQLAEQFSQALAGMKRDGSFARIMAKAGQ